MSTRSPDAEEALEKATLGLFSQLGWETANAYHEVFGEAASTEAGPDLGREHRGQVVLLRRLRDALEKLNPKAPSQALDGAIAELTRDRSALTPAEANRQVYRLLKDGVKVTSRGDDGNEKIETIRVIDWEKPDNNDFLLVQQFWITGDIYTRRTDLVGFVNGIPLLFGELKAHHKRIYDAYQKNLDDYKDTIPHLFWYNGFIILSNGSDARIGTITAGWEHFSRWKKINSEGEGGVISLETLLRGTCEPARFLDILENYILYHETRGGLAKLVAKYHQYLGVEQAMRAVEKARESKGRLGVFWHTQGSGKSFSMIFLSQKILRRLGGNWTFVVLTDRIDLDDQIYKNFARSGAVTESEERCRAQSSKHLQHMLNQEDHRYVFTLIHKFGTRGGAPHPVLSERDDIIVMTDEAHRTQYDVLAMNMRQALPKASFLAFTGTPLIAGEEKTREVFGDYVSTYNFRQSVEDQATVPLYYENRIPELELTNQDLNADMERLLEEAELDEAQEEKLARQFARQYHLITRDDRLERIAEDIVRHFVERGYRGKAMVISIDKLTTVRMYEKVQKHWAAYLEDLKARARKAKRGERKALRERIAFMKATDMAVVISQEQGEVKKFKEHGLDIRRHRKRVGKEDLDEKFKDPENPLRLAFVCAMWRTGFDAPACSTIYLDRPMRNHTLMQTIARANRVFGQKVNGLIVDYVGIFRELQQALAIYGTGTGGGIEAGDSPVQHKDALVERLEEAIAAAEAFCTARGVDIYSIVQSEGFQRIALMNGAVEKLVEPRVEASLDDAVEKIILNDDLKAEYLSLAGEVDRVFRAILPDTRAADFAPRRRVFVVLAKKIRNLTGEPDISGVMALVGGLLDKSVSARGYKIPEPSVPYDLSQIDFEALREQFDKGRKRTQAQRLRRTIEVKLERMVRSNPTRMDYLAEFKRLIDEYNMGARNVEELFKSLVDFAQRLSEEEQRTIAEKLSEEELAIFDILTRPGPDLSEKERKEVKAIASELLETLKSERLVLDWRKRQQSRAAVQVAIRDLIYRLPKCFSEALCKTKSAALYQHVYSSYFGAGQSVYAAAG